MKSRVRISGAIALLILCAINLSAQWKVVSGPYSSRILSLAVQGAYVYAGTDVGVYRSTDYGQSWSESIDGIGAYSISCVAANENVVLAYQQDAGMFRSTDHGKSWHTANSGLAKAAYTTIYAASNAFYVQQAAGTAYYSSDNGISWNASDDCYTSGSAVYKGGMYSVCNHDSLYIVYSPLQRHALAKMKYQTVYHLAVDDTTYYSEDNAVLYMASLHNPVWKQRGYCGLLRTMLTGNFGLFSCDMAYARVSTNQGGYWDYAKIPNDVNHAVSCIAASDDVMLIGTTLSGVYRSTDKGKTWQMSNTGLHASAIQQLSSNANTAYCATALTGAWVSSDKGEHWSATKADVSDKLLSAIGCKGSKVFISSAYGMFRSFDGCASWEACNDALPLSPASAFRSRDNTLFCLLDGIAERSTNDGTSWIRSSGGLNDSLVSDICADPSILLCSTNTGVFRSEDDGLSWKPYGAGDAPRNVDRICATETTILAFTNSNNVYAAPRSTSQWTRVATLSSTVRSVSVDNNRVLLVQSDGKVSCSTDQGKSWVMLNSEMSTMQAACCTTLNGELLVGSTLGTIYKGSISDLLTEATRMWQVVPESDHESVYCLTNDGGDVYAGCQASGVYLVQNNLSWSSFIKGMGPITIQGLYFAPPTLYAASFSFGVYCSSFGANWSASAQGINTPYTTCLCADSSKAYVGTKVSGVFSTMDNGKSWSPSNTGLGTAQINDLSYRDGNLCAATPYGLYISRDWAKSWSQVKELPTSSFSCVRSMGSEIYAGNDKGEIYATLDNGQSWQRVKDRLKAVQALVVTDSLLYCGTSSGVLYSSDKGRTWTPVASGLIGTDIRSLLVCNNTLYAGSYQKGLWYIPIRQKITSEVRESDRFGSTELLQVQCYPNPAQETLSVDYTLKNATELSFRIRDLLGKVVSVVKLGFRSAGEYRELVSLENIPSGEYLLELSTNNAHCIRSIQIQR